MTSLGVIWLVSSTVAFVLIMLLVQVEKKRGKRLLLGSVRGWLDKTVAGIERKLSDSWNHFTKYILQLGWYYGLHSFLRAILKTLVAFYGKVEHLFEVNRKRTKQLRAEKKQVTNPSHLTEMAQHKLDTALTPTQQKKLKDTHLEGE